MRRHLFLFAAILLLFSHAQQLEARTAFYATIYAASTSDPSGVVAISDTGIITPFAISAGFGQPEGLALDSAGNVFFAEDKNIWKVTPTGSRTLFASGSLASSFYGLAIDAADNVYVSDLASSGFDILKFDSAGTLQTSFNTGGVFAIGLSIGPDGFLYGAEQGAIGKYDLTDGSRTTYYQFNAGYEYYSSFGLAFNQAGELFVSGLGEPDSVIKVVGSDPFNPTITSIVSSGVGDLHGIAFDPNGTLMMANWTCGCGTNENGILALVGSTPSPFALTGELSPNFLVALPIPEPSPTLFLGVAAVIFLKKRRR